MCVSVCWRQCFYRTLYSCECLRTWNCRKRLPWVGIPGFADVRCPCWIYSVCLWRTARPPHGPWRRPGGELSTWPYRFFGLVARLELCKCWVYIKNVYICMLTPVFLQAVLFVWMPQDKELHKAIAMSWDTWFCGSSLSMLDLFSLSLTDRKASTWTCVKTTWRRAVDMAIRIFLVEDHDTLSSRIEGLSWKMIHHRLTKCRSWCVQAQRKHRLDGSKSWFLWNYSWSACTGCIPKKFTNHMVYSLTVCRLTNMCAKSTARKRNLRGPKGILCVGLDSRHDQSWNWNSGWTNLDEQFFDDILIEIWISVVWTALSKLAPFDNALFLARLELRICWIHIKNVYIWVLFVCWRQCCIRVSGWGHGACNGHCFESGYLVLWYFLHLLPTYTNGVEHGQRKSPKWCNKYQKPCRSTQFVSERAQGLKTAAKTAARGPNWLPTMFQEGIWFLIGWFLLSYRCFCI